MRVYCLIRFSVFRFSCSLFPSLSPQPGTRCSNPEELDNEPWKCPTFCPTLLLTPWIHPRQYCKQNGTSISLVTRHPLRWTHTHRLPPPPRIFFPFLQLLPFFFFIFCCCLFILWPTCLAQVWVFSPFRTWTRRERFLATSICRICGRSITLLL